MGVAGQEAAREQQDFLISRISTIWVVWSQTPQSSVKCQVPHLVVEELPAKSAYQTKWSHCTLPVLSGRLGQYIHHLPLV